MSNTLFTATDINDRIENKLIEPHFGFQVELLKGAYDNVTLYIGFLPNDIFTKMEADFSKEEIATVKEIYDKFNGFYVTDININTAIKTRFPSVNRNSLPMIKRHVDVIIGIYEKKNNTTMKDLFRAAMGISDKSVLPRFLQKQIFG